MKSAAIRKVFRGIRRSSKGAKRIKPRKLSGEAALTLFSRFLSKGAI